MEYVTGKKLSTLSAEQWSDLASNHSEVWLDVGTGDGLYVYEMARQHPQVLCVGFDPVWENMSEISRRAARKPQKGGAANALFLKASLENYPQILKGQASRISVNYPWAGVLRGVILGEAQTLKQLRELGRGQSSLELFINYHVLSSAPDRSTLQLPHIDPSYIEQQLLPLYHQHGFICQEHQIISGQAPIRSSWAKQLALGSARDTLHLRFIQT